MFWITLVLSAYSISTCLAALFDTTGQPLSYSVINPLTNILLASATKNLSSTACDGCTASIYEFGILWHTSLYTHTAATVVLLVNNASNVTQTSTIQASGFVIPASLNYNFPQAVPYSIFTTTLGGTEYAL